MDVESSEVISEVDKSRIALGIMKLMKELFGEETRTDVLICTPGPLEGENHELEA